METPLIKNKELTYWDCLSRASVVYHRFFLYHIFKDSESDTSAEVNWCSLIDLNWLLYTRWGSGSMHSGNVLSTVAPKAVTTISEHNMHINSCPPGKNVIRRIKWKQIAIWHTTKIQRKYTTIPEKILRFFYSSKHISATSFIKYCFRKNPKASFILTPSWELNLMKLLLETTEAIYCDSFSSLLEKIAC